MKLTRRQSRYLRRKEKRVEKRIQRAKSIGKLEDIFSFDKVFNYGRKCCNGVRWKHSVQKFELHLFSNTAKCINRILSNKFPWSKCHHFILNERGKQREIDAPLIRDRQAQKVITQEILIPLYSPLLIYNNGASLKGKGLNFSFKKLKQDLLHYYRKYGINGHIIITDFSHFFPNANHDLVRKHHKNLHCDEEITKLLDTTTQLTDEKQGLPLGIENSQMEMINYPFYLDNYMKCQLGLKYSGHYMDDYYMIVPPNLDPKEIFAKFKKKAEENHIIVSDHKTKIIPFGKPFRYCKTKFIIKENGKILTHGSRDTIKRARRKFKFFVKKMQNDKIITYTDIWDSFQSVIAYYKKNNDYGRLIHIKLLFKKLFGFWPKNRNQFLERDNKKVNQMQYITHHEYDGKTMEAIPVIIKKGEKLNRLGDILYYNNLPICIYRSLVGKQHFSPNDDNNGLIRGEISYAIAYEPRIRFGGPEKNYQQRFTDEEISILNTKYDQYLKPDIDMLLFNDKFFEESIEKLKEIAKAVNIEIPTEGENK